VTFTYRVTVDDVIAGVTVLVGLLLLGVVPREVQTLGGGTLILTGTGAGIALFLLFLWVRRRVPWGHVGALAGIFYAFGFPVIFVGAIQLLNLSLDDGPARTHVVRVINRESVQTYYRSGSPRGTEEHLVVESWRQPGTQVRIAVTRQVFDKFETGGNRLAVTTRPGFFGAEWIATLEVVPEPGRRR
jgi:hypothetical protein